MMKFIGKWAPESLGVFGLLFFGFWAHSGGLPPAITVLVAVLSGFSLWVATWIASKLAKEGKKGRVANSASILATALPMLTSLMIKMQGLGHDVTVWITVFFWCGVTLGLAMGAYGTYHQMK